MFQLTFENDYPTADSNHWFLHLWRTATPGPCSPRVPVLWAEEEQADEDEKTTQEIEKEKLKDKKRDQREDSLKRPQSERTQSSLEWEGIPVVAKQGRSIPSTTLRIKLRP